MTRGKNPSAERRVDMRRLGLKVTPKVERAMRYLESWGQRFLIDFGTDNALSNARGLAAIYVPWNIEDGEYPDRTFNRLLDRHIAQESGLQMSTKAGAKRGAR